MVLKPFHNQPSGITYTQPRWKLPGNQYRQIAGYCMSVGHGPTKYLHDINWGAFDASHAPQFLITRYTGINVCTSVIQ